MSETQPAPLLRVRCPAQCGRVGSDGYLIIEPWTVRFEFAFMRKALRVPPVIHAQPPLVWKRARLLPPGLNSGLVLRGEEGTVAVYTFWGVARRIRSALLQAEVPVIDEIGWISIGRSDGRAGRRTPGSVS